MYDIGECPDLEELADPHSGAAMLKLYLRDFHEPLLTFDLYPKFLEVIQSDSSTYLQFFRYQWYSTCVARPVKVRTIIDLIHRQLPDVNFLVLKLLLSLLRRVSQFSEVNKMTLSNLATVFGPNFLKPRDSGVITISSDSPSSPAVLPLDAQAMMKDMLLVNDVVELLIENER